MFSYFIVLIQSLEKNFTFLKVYKILKLDNNEKYIFKIDYLF